MNYGLELLEKDKNDSYRWGQTPWTSGVAHLVFVRCTSIFGSIYSATDYVYYLYCALCQEPN